MTIGSLYNAANVIVGQAAVYFAPANTALPVLSTWNIADPFDATFLTSPWVHCGATDQGWTVTPTKNKQEINIEEQSTPVAVTLTSQMLTISGALSEDISPILGMALNADVVATSPTSTVPGYDTLTLNDIPKLYAVALVTTNPQGYGRIIYAPSWTQLDGAAVAFRRAAAKRTYAVAFETVCQTNLIKVINFTAPHS